MKGFIEVHIWGSTIKFLISVAQIIGVIDYGKYSFISVVMRTKKRREVASGCYIVETYDEVVAKIKAATE